MKVKQFFVLSLAFLALVGCKKTSTEEAVTVQVSINPATASVKVGETTLLSATVTPTGAATVTWESSAPDKASVDQNGLVTGLVASSNVYIIAKAGSAQANCRLTVYEEGAVVIQLDQLSASIVKGNTLQLKATVTPADKASSLVWESDNTAVATVDNTGLITAVAKGTANVIAKIGDVKASCAVTVTDPSGGGGSGETINHQSLKGSDYFIFQLGDAEYNQIQSKIVADFRENGTDKFLYVWESTYDADATSGKNFYGQVEGWVALKVLSVGWSGMAYNCQNFPDLNKLYAIMSEPQNYYLHLAMKSTDQASHLVFLDGTSGSGKFCIGSTDFVDGGTTYKPKTNFTRNGEWGEMEICMKDLTDMGLVYGNNNTEAKNLFGFLSGGTAGTMLQFDAAFIYKKAQP